MPELRTKEFNRIVDRYLQTGTMTADDYDSLTDVQREVVQCIKRAFNRLKPKEYARKVT